MSVKPRVYVFHRKLWDIRPPVRITAHVHGRDTYGSFVEPPENRDVEIYAAILHDGHWLDISKTLTDEEHRCYQETALRTEDDRDSNEAGLP